MSKVLTASVKTYKTNQGDMWDIISLIVYGDEHGMNALQDANYEYRFIDAFAAGIVLTVPQSVVVTNDLGHVAEVPNISQLLPWR